MDRPARCARIETTSERRRRAPTLGPIRKAPRRSSAMRAARASRRTARAASSDASDGPASADRASSSVRVARPCGPSRAERGRARLARCGSPLAPSCARAAAPPSESKDGTARPRATGNCSDDARVGTCVEARPASMETTSRSSRSSEGCERGDHRELRQRGSRRLRAIWRSLAAGEHALRSGSARGRERPSA